MCLVLLGSQLIEGQPLILAANRDEFHHRPTLAMHRWQSDSGIQILSGIDIECGGTWLALADNGRFAAVTNVRTGHPAVPSHSSRGELPLQWINCDQPSSFANLLVETSQNYGPFNLLFGSVDQLYCFHSPSRELQQPGAGLHGLSNASLNTPWPKVISGKAKFEQALQQPASARTRALFQALADRQTAADSALPSTGVSLEAERILSASFICTREYGTRSSSVVCCNGTCWWCYERSYTPQGELTSETSLSLAIRSIAP